MKICKIKENYIDFLRQYDDKVLYNKKETRPYVGVLFNIGEVKYFAPLSSPKAKFSRMKNYIDFIKIDNGRLGAINLNNMIPVVKEVILDFKIDELSDKEYKNLLYNQLDYINDNAKLIVKSATILYNKVNNFNGRVKSRCVNFKLLEEKIKEYNKGDF